MQLTEPRLLIADDDRDFRESLGEVFGRRGYEIVLAADGQEAVDIALESVALGCSTLHLVLLDVHMPRLTGLQALLQIRQESLFLPCILMSAMLDEQIVQRANELNTSDVLAKPFTLRDLTTCVEKVLNQSYGDDGTARI